MRPRTKKINFLGQRFQKLEPYRQADTQRDVRENSADLPSWVNFKVALQQYQTAEITTYFAEVPDLVEPLQRTDVSTASSTMCLQLEPPDPSLICRSCVHTSLFAPMALSHQMCAAEQHNIIITLSHKETYQYCTRPKLTSSTQVYCNMAATARLYNITFRN